MRYAIDEGYRITAQPDQHALCELCGRKVIAHCGQVKVWHWAHGSREDCDTWSEPMTQWHRDWQNRFPKDCQEVVLPPHRADVRTRAGRIIEFQHSGISVPDIRERQDFYGPDMFWVFDATEAVASGRLELRAKRGEQDRYRTFRWKHPRKTLLGCSRPPYLDVGNGMLLHLDKMGTSAPYGGWGRLVTADEFVGFFS